MDKEKEFTHPSYGLVSFSHRQGNPKLFHSALENHYNYVTLSIKNGTLIRSDTGDRLYGPMHGNIVEVDLSASQFAELLTTMNIGTGVACTIRSLNNKSVPPPPDIDSQPENLRSEFKARARSFTEGIMKETEEVGTLLKDKASLSRADRSKITSILNRVAQELAQNMPFFVEMYQEATEKVVDAAKAEIEGFMVGAVRQAGLAALAAGKVDVTPPQLPVKKVEVKSERPPLLEALIEVMGSDELTISQVHQRLAVRGWAPNSDNPESYIAYMLADNKDKFVKIVPGGYKVVPPA